MISCKGEKSISDDQKMENSVRNYLFIGDSIDVSISITDTISIDDLDMLMSTTNVNLNLIQLDIDTLGSMIDDLAYGLQKPDSNTSLEMVPGAEVSFEDYLLVRYKLQYAELNAQKFKFTQTNRVLYQLKRSVWANVAGFDVLAKYELNGEELETMVLMDAEFRVID